jgi:hypothetical protein
VSLKGTSEDTVSGSAVLAAVFGGLLAFAVLNAAAIWRSVGGFEYPLDDVYIHLAVAEQIAHGGYGVNAGEFASAASSPLYPFLLSPFADSSMQRWYPLFWNVASLIAASALFGLAVARANMGALGLFIAAIAPIALNMYVVAFTGMENMAHGAASLAIVLGLWKFMETGRIGGLLIAGVFLAPALRLEGAALALAAGGTVLVLGHVRAGIGLMALGLLPLVLFSGFLLSIGLGVLPNSVVAKLADGGSGDANLLLGAVGKFTRNVQTYGGRFLLALVVTLAVLSVAASRKNPRPAVFGLAVAVAGLAHLVFGSVGWMERYENYILISVAAALALMLSEMARGVKAVLLGAVMAAGIVTYMPYAKSVYVWNPRAIQSQQGEMARFAKAFADAPVAVNDLGYVSWRNPNYVLDLWGLASREALEARLGDAPQGWAGTLVDTKDVPLVMVYDNWLSDAISPNWVRLGTMSLAIPTAFLGGADVTFYATRPDGVATFAPLLREWAADLPVGTTFVFAENGT